MARLDRLSALVGRFQISAHPADVPSATFLCIQNEDGTPERLLLGATPFRRDFGEDHVLLAARIDWGGAFNPLLLALPNEVDMCLSNDAETRSLLLLISAELDGNRCGVGSVVSRLTEVLVVRILRHQIEKGGVETGLLAGLSDPRLSRSLVAMHEAPGKPWRNDDLAAIAGLSLSRFVEHFQQRVGETPAAYLRRWRMTLANQDLERGARIDTVARTYGFQSPEGFSRAFKRHFGVNAITVRKKTAPQRGAHLAPH